MSESQVDELLEPDEDLLLLVEDVAESDLLAEIILVGDTWKCESALESSTSLSSLRLGDMKYLTSLCPDLEISEVVEKGTSSLMLLLIDLITVSA